MLLLLLNGDGPAIVEVALFLDVVVLPFLSFICFVVDVADAAGIYGIYVIGHGIVVASVAATFLVRGVVVVFVL